jgi:RNA polymerase sigma-70 factor (ECF subfamily)
VASETIEDLLQDSMLKLCSNNFAILHDILEQPDEVLEGYIKATIFNRVRDRYRQERSLRRQPAEGLVSLEGTLGQFADARSTAAVERDLLIREIDEILARKLIGSSAARDRRVFWLHYRHELTAKAIAAIPTIGLTNKGVESLLLRLRILVKEELMDAKGIAAGDTSL